MRRTSAKYRQVSIDTLRSILRYDEASGRFERIVTRGSAVAGRIAGSVSSNGYIDIRACGFIFKAHVLAWAFQTGSWPERTVDHRNLDRTDNRWANLREASDGQNRANCRLRSHSTVGLKGVGRCPRKVRFTARITVEGKAILLGSFGTAEAAHRAFCEASVRYRGEFARAS